MSIGTPPGAGSTSDVLSTQICSALTVNPARSVCAGVIA
jgi:hypothetical protein